MQHVSFLVPFLGQQRGFCSPGQRRASRSTRLLTQHQALITQARPENQAMKPLWDLSEPDLNSCFTLKLSFLEQTQHKFAYGHVIDLMPCQVAQWNTLSLKAEQSRVQEDMILWSWTNSKLLLSCHHSHVTHTHTHTMQICRQQRSRSWISLL